LLFTEKVDEYAAQSENFCKKELEKYDIRTKAQYDDYAGMVYACKRVVKSPSEHCDETNQKCEAIRNAAKESAEELNREIMATRNNAINEMKKVAEKIKQELRNRHAHLLTQIMRVPPNNYAELIKSADDVMRD
jgi:hypothetical protein